MSTVRLALLGPIHIERDHERVELNIAKLQGLLGYLAVTRTAHTRDHLLALLWAESHPEAARKNLRNRLWQLRQTLGEAVAISHGERIALATSVASDVAEFEDGMRQQLQTGNSDQLAALLDLWRGPLLDGIHLSEAPDFELWLTSERERLGQLYLQGLSALIQTRRQAADWQSVIQLAQRGLTHDPLREELVQQLMFAYAQQGSRNEALRHYDQLRTMLHHELGVEPLPATTALRAAIVDHEVGSRQTADGRQQTADGRQQTVDSGQQSPISNLQSPIPIPPSALRPPHSVPFVGRQAQFAALDLALQQAHLGRCKVVMLSGELGIGKSRLWQMWAAQQVPNHVVLETRCLNTTQSVPFDPIRRLLNSARIRSQFSLVAENLLPVWRTELLRLAPILQQAITAPETSIALTPAEESAHVAEALTQLLRSFQAQPLLLFLDDLHWADEATLNWLLYFTDRMSSEPVLLVAAYRPEDAPATLQKIINQWQREGVLQRIHLPHLTRPEASELLTTLGGNLDMVDYLHTQSRGNPYYLTQLSDVVVDGVPSDLAELVRARLSYLSPDLQQVVQAAAVLEPAIELEILRHLTQRSEDQTVDALDGLLNAAVLVERESSYEFSHPLVATVVRDSLSRARSKVLHRRAAEWLTTQHADHLERVAGPLARHFDEAGEAIQAAHFAELAAEQSLLIGAASEAAAFYRQALSLEPTPARRLGLGSTLMMIPGKIADARAAMQQALEEFEAQRECPSVIKAGLRLAASYLAEQQGAQVLYWARRVLPDLETVDDPAMHASAHYLMGTAKYRNGYSMNEAEAHYAAATRLVTAYQLESEIALMSWFEWGNLCLERGDFALAIEKFQQARSVAQTSKSIFLEALSLNNLAYASLLGGALVDAQQFIERGLALTETYALAAPQQYFYSTRGEILLVAGALDEAESSFRQALTLAEKFDNPTFIANLHAHLGRVAQAQGDLDKALQLLTAARAALSGGSAHYLQTQIDLWLSDLYLQRNQAHQAEQSLQQAEERLRGGQNRGLSQVAARLRAQLKIVA